MTKEKECVCVLQEDRKPCEASKVNLMRKEDGGAGMRKRECQNVGVFGRERVSERKSLMNNERSRKGEIVGSLCGDCFNLG